jgi:hypothetical protein
MLRWVASRVAFACLAAVPVVLHAAEVPGMSANYGNEAGCRYAATGEYNDESMVLLKPDEFQTFVMLCGFVEVLVARDGSHIVTTLCGHEGEAEQTIEHLRIVKDAAGADVHEVFGASGELWGRVDRCR